LRPAKQSEQWEFTVIGGLYNELIEDIFRGYYHAINEKNNKIEAGLRENPIWS